MISKEAYYTVPSKTFNPTSQYQKMIRLYDKKLGLFLPNSQWVYGLDQEKVQQMFHRIHMAANGKYICTAFLSDEQKKIMTRVYARIQKCGYSSGIINMKTGRGKTLVMTEIGNRLDGKVLILCHNEINCKMMVEHYEKFYIGIGARDI